LYHVVTHLNLFGTNSLAFATLSAIRGIENISPASYATADPGVSQEPRYTGLVIDSRGKPVDKVIVAVIYDEEGRIIYNSRNLPDAVLIARGTCRYDKIDNLGKPDFGAGSSPLTVKPISLRDSNRNIIVSRDDGLKILSTTKQNNFLSQSAVTILVDSQ
jgi:hypothetical protein